MCPCPADKAFLRFRQLLFAFPHDAVIRVYDGTGQRDREARTQVQQLA